MYPDYLNPCRLQSDVDFFNEINRWISVKCAMSHGKRGKLKKESELILLKKADAIVSCFLRSCVPPKVSVNLPQRIIEDIEKRLDDPKKLVVFFMVSLNAFRHLQQGNPLLQSPSCTNLTEGELLKSK